ncbi:MAG TPA: hypothetical protein DDW52_14175 [Planctomycetaceae bacterium]|nr:hypothetical protein [Planctomycetaceae bacterium]
MEAGRNKLGEKRPWVASVIISQTLREQALYSCALAVTAHDLAHSVQECQCSVVNDVCKADD